MKQKIRTTAYTLGALLFVLAGMIVAFLIIFKRLHANVEFTKNAQQTLALYEHNRDAWKDANTTFTQDEALVASLGKHIITQATTPDFLSKLESMATARAITLTITSVASSPIDTTPGLLVVCTVEGVFSSVEAFLEDLEHMPQQVVFTTLSLQKEPEGDGVDQKSKLKSAGPLWQGTIAVRVVSYKK